MVSQEKTISYEHFMLALWMWNYLKGSTPFEKKQAIRMILDQKKSIWEYVRDTTMKLADPRDSQFQECIAIAEEMVQ